MEHAEHKSDPRVAKHVQDWTPGEIIDAGEEIERLFTTPGWALVEEIVTAAKASGMERLIDATVKEQAEYAQALGVLNGMTFARDVAETLLAKAEWAREEIRMADAEQAPAEGS